LRHANRVVGISEFSQVQVVRQHQIDPRRMASLPCMLDDTLLKIEPADARVSIMIPKEKRVVLTVARMAASERYKGHDFMFQALSSIVAKVPDVSYVVVGDGDDRERLEELVQSLGIMEHVLFTGEVDDSALAALYRRSDVFALPARTVIDDRDPKGEGFGIVYLEALAFGKPVIGPNCGAPAEIIRHGEHGLLVNPENPLEIADALLCLLSNPAKAKTMGAAGIDWVHERYSIDSFRERLRGILAASTQQGHAA
jgi:glycosyltransferase involved in cell wall biosynthesis